MLQDISVSTKPRITNIHSFDEIIIKDWQDRQINK
jgi:hypothetical protein